MSANAHQLPTLSALTDPVSLAKLQILLVPVHVSESGGAAPRLTEGIYEHWASVFRRHTAVRGDELVRSSSGGSTPGGTFTHRRGSTNEDARSRFLPSASGVSISRAASAVNIHLAYPSHPPAKHLYPLSLLRISAFPLIVIGIAVSDDNVAGYQIGEDAPSAEGSEAAASEAQAAFHQALGSILPPTSPFPLVKRLVMVPTTLPVMSPRPSPSKPSSRNGTPRLGGPAAEASEVRHAPLDGVESWITRLLGEVVGEVCGELGELAASLESPAGLKTLSGTLLPSLSSTLPLTDSIVTSPTGTPGPDIPRASTGTPTQTSSSASGAMSPSNSLPSVPGIIGRALTPGGRPTSVQAPSAPPIQTSAIAPAPTPVPTSSSNPFRRSTALTSPFTRTSSSASITSSPSTTTLPNAPKYTSAPLAGVAGGRLMKLLGDMYLLTGMYGDAIKCYDDGAEKCRSVGDVLWEALAREGRAVAGVGEAWEGRDGSNHSMPFPSSPIPVEILSHYLSSLACIARSPLPFPPTIIAPSPKVLTTPMSLSGPNIPHAQTGTGENLLAWLYSTLCLRISHFSFIIWAAGGWGSIALSSLMTHTLPRAFPVPDEATLSDPDVRRERRRALGMLSSRSQIPRHTIIGHAQAALGPHHRALTSTEQLATHVEVVWLARWLAMERKEAAGSREVVKRVALLIVEGREEVRRAAARSSNPPSASAGAPPSASTDTEAVGLGLGLPLATPTVGVRRREPAEGNVGVVRLLERAMDVLGIDLTNLASSETPRVAPDTDAMEPIRFGWPELQVETMKEGIAVAEALPDHPAVVRLCLSALRELHPFLNPTSQAHLSRMFPQSLATARRRGFDIAVPWWMPGKVILSIEVTTLAANKLPIRHSRAEIAPTGKRDPFLYNPRLKAEAGKTVLVANEAVDIYVTIQNVFAFDLDIQELTLLTTGVPFTSSSLSLILPSSSVQTVRVTGTATQPGSLQIKGASVRLSDGSSAELLLPVFDPQGAERLEKRRSKIAADLAKVKRQGLDARRSIPPDSHEETPKWLECTVLEEQPLVWVKKTSLTHGTVMLYHGEGSTIRITLENCSPVPVDFVKLSFDDSVSRDAQAALEAEPTPEQAYEIDFETLKRPVFSWDTGGRVVATDVSILPGARTTLTINCLGKVGCTDGSIRIDYGYVGRAGDAFYTRHVTLPVLMTVYRTLELQHLELSRLAPGTSTSSSSFALAASAGGTPSTDALRQALAHAAEDYVLLCLTVRNVYGLPFEVFLRRNAEEGKRETIEVENGPLVVSRLVPPGATERIVLPILRVSLSAADLATAIPTLSDRQYVVDTRPVADARRAKELFWFKQALQSRYSVSWQEPGSLRSGTLSTRGLGMGAEMVQVLRMDGVDVALVVDEPTVGAGAGAGEAGLDVKATDFVTLRAVVTNRLEQPIRPFVRLEPAPDFSTSPPSSTASSAAARRQSLAPPPPAPAPHALKHVAFDGVLAAHLGEVLPGQTGELVVGAVFLAAGTYAFRAAVDVDGSSAVGTGVGQGVGVVAGAGKGGGKGKGAGKDVESLSVGGSDFGLKFSPMLKVEVAV